MARALALLLLCFPLTAGAALEDWSCLGIADYYANVAIDRDAGMSSKDRSNLTVKHIIIVMDSEAGIEVAAEDAQALLRIVQYVYWHRGTAYQIRREALLRCLKGNSEPPIARPMGGREL